MKTNSNIWKSLTIVWALLLTGVVSYAQPKQFTPQYFRYYDQRGVNVFETSKTDSVEFNGVKVRLGANFTQGFQTLNHSNSAKAILTATGLPSLVETAPGSGSFVDATGTPVTGIVQHPTVIGGYLNSSNQLYMNGNQLYDISNGFPLAQANLNLDVQLLDGVRLNLVSYMSSHHHNEFWVKGGYIQVDKVGFLNSEMMDKLWKNLTLKVGHMEVNYGDAHFRRNDGGNTFYNPFIENNIMDSYSTEIGGELYWQNRGIIAMVGFTDGEIQGSVTKPGDRKPSIYGKVGIDRIIGGGVGRARLTGSFYTTKSSISNTIYGGDRTGSNYQYVMEPVSATLTGNAFSGRVNPGFKDNVTAFMINPFVKYAGLEFFGTWELSMGNSQVENGEVQNSNPSAGELTKLDNRQFNQYEADVLYRFGKDEKFYVGAKYNTLNGTLAFGQSTSGNINQGTRGDVTINRTSVAAGWYISKNIMFKAEYVNQNYKDYPDTSILSGGKFNGFVFQGSIGF